MTTVEPRRAIIIGAGLMGRWHADAAARFHVRIAAVVDPDLVRARALASRYRDCVAETDLRAALRGAGAHAVHLCTPTATHEDLAAAAIGAGCHVLVEKPLASTFAATRRLVEMADDRGLLICPCHQFVFQRGFLRACAALPGLGAVRHVDFLTCSAGADGRSDLERDEIAIDILPHPFSLLARVLASGLTDIAWHVQHPAPGELRLWGGSNGVTAAITVSMSGRPTVNALRVIAERGSVHCDLFHGYATVERGAISRSRKISRPFTAATTELLTATANLARRAITRELAYPGLRELMRRFYLAAGAAGVPPFSADEILAVARAREEVLAVTRLRQCS
jgi:predicted dehydrogenase